MKVIAVIPARFASTRFPGKPLALIGGKPMVIHVVERTLSTQNINQVVVATDHPEILNTVKHFGFEAIMTSDSHESGTDRCAEVLHKLDQEFDVVSNIQGDEPFIEKASLDQLVSCFDNSDCEIATLYHKISDPSQIDNPSSVKLVKTNDGKALYFSRSPIPFSRENSAEKTTNYYKHIGLYGFKADVLKAVTKLPVSTLEQTEKLEQLRWLENGFSIYVAEANNSPIAVDTPNDLKKAQEYFNSQG